MTYAETIDFLFSQLAMYQSIGAAAYKPGLDTARTLDRAFGSPSERLRAIHVAGTNGKGSTSHSLAAICTAAGLRTGLFTSPHLLDFRERIRIDGEMIPEDEVTAFVERYRAMNLPIRPSFFELTTVMAFDWFARSGVDVAVVEVGLGGRLDSTNILPHPILTIVTNISLDHTAMLGKTVGEIAAEKAGIFKPGVPAIIGEAAEGSIDVLMAKAEAVGAPAEIASEAIPFSSFSESPEGYIDYSGTPFGDIRADLSGECQPRNMATILTAARTLSAGPLPEVTPEAVRRGLASVCKATGLMGRWMMVGNAPLTICDTGHNIGGWEYIVRRLTATPRHKEMVIGFVNDKDVTAVLCLASAIPNATFRFAQASVARALPAEELAEIARDCGIDGTAYPTVEEAYRAASAAAKAEDMIFVGGSTFVVADFLANFPAGRIVDKA